MPISRKCFTTMLCPIDSMGIVKVPSKSQLQRYETFVGENIIAEIIYSLLKSANQNYIGLSLSEPIDISNLYIDLTCIKANIHYPVDWVLLRDATITLMKAIKIIRNHGLKNRMEQPEVFIKGINNLSIEMTHSQYKHGKRKSRKKILRLMKKLLKKIMKHAQKHINLLENNWKNTDLSEKQKDQIIKRMNNVIEQLPAAIEQAHERIIGERQVANDEKILSLYEPDVHVIVRGKSGARVEYGNSIFLAEQKDGLIVDWNLYKDQAPADCKTLIPAIERIDKGYGIQINSITGDRGFWSEENAEYLDNKEITNNICPRSVRKLSKKLKSKKFKKSQTRRAQTEGRIGIIKNCFIGNPIRSKGFANQELSVAYAILTHNLWVLARLIIANETTESQEAI
jgi:IS5 family transposase